MSRQESVKYDYIDSLRGIAVLLVLFVHTGNIYKYCPVMLGNLATVGRHGVQLFYLMSAFTLFLSFSQKWGKERNPILNFFIRRFFRIAPMFYLAVILYLPLGGSEYWLGDAPGISKWNLLATLTFTNGWNPYWINSVIGVNWSIAVEVTFYILIPLLYFRITNVRSAMIWFCASLFLAELLAFFLYRHPLIQHPVLWEGFLYMFFPRQFPVFTLGILLFFVKKHIDLNQDQQKFFIRHATQVLLFAIFLWGGLAFIPVPFIPTHYLHSIVFWIFSFSLALVPNKYLVNSFTKGLGKISYSIYLTHWGCVYFLSIMLPQTLLAPSLGITAGGKYFLTFLLLLSMSSSLSWVTYKFIEKPGQDWGRRLIDKLEGGGVK